MPLRAINSRGVSTADALIDRARARARAWVERPHPLLRDLHDRLLFDQDERALQRAVVHEFQRPRRPGAVQFVAQVVLVGQAIQTGGRRVLRGDPHGQHRSVTAIGFQVPYPAEGTITVLPQDLEATVFKRAEPRRRLQLLAPHQAVAAVGRSPSFIPLDRPHRNKY